MGSEARPPRGFDDVNSRLPPCRDPERASNVTITRVGVRGNHPLEISPWVKSLRKRSVWPKDTLSTTLARYVWFSLGLLGKEYAKDTDLESDHHLHLLDEHVPAGSKAARGATDGLWRVSLEAVDGWALRHGVAVEDAADDEGPFARLLSNN